MRMEGPSEAELKTYYGIVLRYGEDQLCSETMQMTKNTPSTQVTLMTKQTIEVQFDSKQQVCGIFVMF